MVCSQGHIMPPGILQLIIKLQLPEDLTKSLSYVGLKLNCLIRMHKGPMGHTQIPNSASLPYLALTLL